MHLALLVLSLSIQVPAVTEARVSTTDALLAVLRAPIAGMRVLLAPGEYRGVHVSQLAGRSDAPIVISAQDPRSPPVFRGPVQLSDVSWLELSHVVVTESATNGLNIDDGGTFDTPSHHVVVRDVLVRDIGAGGNEDGIKLSGVDDFTLDHCTVERWGRGGSAVDMVGCHRGTIRACTLRDREQDAASTGIQTKGGTLAIEIVDCRFEHAGDRAVNVGGSTGMAYFRPKPEGFEAKDITVRGCTFLGSETPIAFVGVDGARVERCTFYRPRKWFARILQETRAEGFVACRKGVFRDNLIVYRASEISTPLNLGPDTAPETFEVAHNFWYCVDDPAHSLPKLPIAETGAQGGVDPRFVDAERGDLTLAPDSPALGYGAEGESRKATPR